VVPTLFWGVAVLAETRLIIFFLPASELSSYQDEGAQSLFLNNFLSSFVVSPVQGLCQERFEGVIGKQMKK